MPEVSIDCLGSTIRIIKLAYINGVGYIPLFERDIIRDRIREINKICTNTQIVKTKALKELYRIMLK